MRSLSRGPMRERGRAEGGRGLAVRGAGAGRLAGPAEAVRKRAPRRAAGVAAVPAGLRRDEGRLPPLPAPAPGAATRAVSRQGAGAGRCYLRVGAEAAQHPPQRAAPLARGQVRLR